MTKEQWKRLYRQIRLGRWEVMKTSFIELPTMSIEIYGPAGGHPKSVVIKP